MATTNLGHPGAFRYTPASGQWTWSEALFGLFGFRPGDVVPTTELVMAHQHPDDRNDLERLLDDVRATGRPGALWHRLRDARGTVRQVVTSVRSERVDDATVLQGEVLDVSEATRRTVGAELDEALTRMAESRPLIEQAKGALMYNYAIDADRAFELLRQYSQLVNVKVRDLAGTLVAAAADGAWPAELRTGLSRVLAGSAERHVTMVEENPGA